MAAVDGGKVQGDGHPARNHTVIIGRREFLFEAAIRLAPHFAADRDGRQAIGQCRYLPFAATGTRDFQAARPGDGQVADPCHAIGNGGHRGFAFDHGRGRRRVGDGLTDGQRAFGAVKPDLQAGAGRNLQHRVGDVVEVKRRLAGIGGGLGPGLPAGAAGHGDGGSGGKARNGRDLPERAEEHRHDKGGQRDVAQAERVAGRQAQVGLDGTGACGAGGHAVLMRAPDGKRGGIVGADHLRVAQGGNRAARHRRVQPVQRVACRGLAEPAIAQDRQPQRQGGDRATGNLCVKKRPQILHPKGQHRQRQQEDRPQRPERPRQTFRPKARQRQPHRPDKRFQRRLRGWSGHLTCLCPDDMSQPRL